MQRRRGKDIFSPGRFDIERRERLVPETVAILQQDQVVGAERPRRDRARAGQAVPEGGGGQNLVIADAGVIDAWRIVRQGDDGGVQLSSLQTGDQTGGQIFADEQPQGRIGDLQSRQFGGQQEGGDGRNHPEAKAAGQGLAGIARCLDQILGARQDVLGPAHGLGADGGQLDPTPGALDDGGAQNPLQLLHARTQRRLADMRSLGGPAERAMLGEQFQILQLAKGGQHADTPEGQSATIRLRISEIYSRVRKD